MIGTECMGMECVRLVKVAFSAFSCSNINIVGSGRFVSTYKLRGNYSRCIRTWAASKRIKREDCTHIKFDSLFSKWKILVGESDWKDHNSVGKEKYRSENIPNCTCPANYELGIANGTELNKIVPVYLGRTNNLRTRLQKYGRNGAHLENASPNGPHLFSEIFSRGFSILYRWAPMKSNKDAETSEEELLAMYDYGWNKKGNRDRRPHEIHTKLLAPYK